MFYYQIKFPLSKEDFTLEDFEEKISRPLQELFSDHLGMETGELYDIEHEEDEDLLGFFTFSFSSEKQFRWDESNDDSLPLSTSNLMVSFTMKGGFFSQLVLIILQNKSDGITEVSFYNKELDEWYDVQISKEVDNQGNSYGRFVDVF